MDTIGAILVALVVAGELYVLWRVVLVLVSEARNLATEKALAGERKAPSPTVSNAPNFVSSSAHNQTFSQPRTQPKPAQASDFERPRWANPQPKTPITEPQKVVVEIPKTQPEPTIRPTSSQSVVPIGNLHVPASCDNYYEVLAILPDSNELEIKSAYRSLIKIWHPDTSKFQNAQASMAAILEAYECLSQPDERKLYDEGLRIQGWANL